MTRFNVVAGSIALFALVGVNAGPCRPSATTSAISSLETAPTTTSLGLSATETVTASTGITELAITDTSTMTEIPTTTADATSLATTTSIGEQEPTDPCPLYPNPYSSNGVTFQIRCGASPNSFTTIGSISAVNNLLECMVKCSQESRCMGAIFDKTNKSCTMYTVLFGFGSLTSYDIAEVAAREQAPE
ncbi:hypothetical protein FHETE_7124 [Fusarium heterosporum]|uniref:Apple domain-containing protein n=1 Tax=Fusarium heterosporum TaxID=42747 RepID=A0A8H5T6W5_FUSHE|nr:hypothetical protein FHETE_7124 [Fusarium heterosporum]